MCSGGGEEAGGGAGGFTFDLVEPISATSLLPESKSKQNKEEKPFSMTRSQASYLSLCSADFDGDSHAVSLSYLHLGRPQRRKCT